MSAIIGIDLGTTFSCVAHFDDKKEEAVVVVNSDGGHTTPSVVAFSDGDEHAVVGKTAKRMARKQTDRVIYDAKRFVGLKFSNKTVQEDIKKLPFKVCGDENDNIQFEVQWNGKQHKFSPEEIGQFVLASLREDCKAALLTDVSECVITVPAYFSNAQREATKAAGKLAGLDVKRVINEPTAAAIKFGAANTANHTEPYNILVFDLGGGTFDVSIMHYEPMPGNDVISTIVTEGDSHLGGRDFDERLAEMIKGDFETSEDTKITKARDIAMLLQVAEEAKCDLSNSNTTSIDFKSFEEDFSRARFEAANMKMFMSAMDLVDKCLQAAAAKDGSEVKTQDDIDVVLLVGGSTKIPWVRNALYEKFGREKVIQPTNSEFVVAQGAAVLAANLSNFQTDGVVLTDVTPMNLGIGVLGGKLSVVVPANSDLPATVKKKYKTTDDDQEAVDIEIYEGKTDQVDDCQPLGMFSLVDLPPAKAGGIQFEITFQVDKEGLLHVEAKHVGDSNLKGEIKVDTQKGVGKPQGFDLFHGCFRTQTGMDDASIDKKTAALRNMTKNAEVKTPVVTPPPKKKEQQVPDIDVHRSEVPDSPGMGSSDSTGSLGHTHKDRHRSPSPIGTGRRRKDTKLRVNSRTTYRRPSPSRRVAKVDDDDEYKMSEKKG